MKWTPAPPFLPSASGVWSVEGAHWMVSPVALTLQGDMGSPLKCCDAFLHPGSYKRGLDSNRNLWGLAHFEVTELNIYIGITSRQIFLEFPVILAHCLSNLLLLYEYVEISLLFWSRKVYIFLIFRPELYNHNCFYIMTGQNSVRWKKKKKKAYKWLLGPVKRFSPCLYNCESVYLVIIHA